MTLEPRTYETAIATLTVLRPDLLEIRYHNDIVFSALTVGDVQRMRREVMGERPYATLTIIPDNVDYNLDAMRQDQAAPDRAASQLLASAVVTKASMIEMLTKLYFSYYPQQHRILVTDDEQAARRWVDEQLEGMSQTG